MKKIFVLLLAALLLLISACGRQENTPATGQKETNAGTEAYDPSKTVEFEMKTTPAALYPQARLEEYVEKVYAAVRSIKTHGSQLVFTSSDYRGLRYLQEHHPDAELLLIVGKPINEETIALAKTVGIKALGCRLEGTSRAMVEKAHEAGLTVSLWPNQKIEDFVLGIYLGADRLCCDIPVAQKQFLEEKMPWVKVIY